MAIILRHRSTDQHFVLLGAGTGHYQSMMPGAVMGHLSPQISEGKTRTICVCNSSGRIKWFDSNELHVISVDGKLVDQVFASLEDLNSSSNGSAKVSADGVAKVTEDEVLKYLDEE